MVKTHNGNSSQGQRTYYVNLPYRSHDSLSLMHHANAAGSCPISVARSPVPAPSMHTSSAVVRQPLTKLDINQQQQQQRPRLIESADCPTAGGQTDAGCPVSMSTEQHQCHHQQQQQQQKQGWVTQSEDAEETHSNGARDAACTATVRQLDQELQLMQKQQGGFQRESNLQNYQQTAGRQHQLYVDGKNVLGNTPEPRHVNNASYYAMISPHSESVHAEESHSPADMLESTSGLKTDKKLPPTASRIAGRQEDQVASDVAVTKPGSSAMEIVQHAWRHHVLDSARNTDNHASQYNQQWQQQQQQNDWQVDLPAGIL